MLIIMLIIMIASIILMIPLEIMTNWWRVISKIPWIAKISIYFSPSHWKDSIKKLETFSISATAMFSLRMFTDLCKTQVTY